MGNLPKERVQPSRPFTNCGIDYTGPFLLKRFKGRCNVVIKAYVALFVCFATRAVHLELVSDLSTESFIAALKRFISRRGKPSHIYSDNGKNFIGTKNNFDTFRQFLQDKTVRSEVDTFLSTEFVTWHLIPAYTPHMGGLWEAGIKSFKTHLKKVLPEQKLTFEEFYTLITTIESCLNSRPLTEISNDPLDLHPLTPGHFLIGAPLTSIVENDISHCKIGLGDRWKLVTKVSQQFWKRWSSEYLSRLQERTKWKLKKGNLEIGNLVLIRNENISPLKWPLGRITKLHKGSDDLVRIVTLRTVGGLITRNIHNICLLPISLENTSQCGEYVKEKD